MIELRNLRHDDLPYLPGLLAALDREPAPWDASWLERKIFGDPDYDSALSPVIEASGRPVALVHGVMRGGGEVVFLKLLAVERTFRRQGFATRLLDTFEARARAAGASSIKIHYCSPTYLLPGLDPSYTAALCLLLRRGYQTDRHSIANMEVDLDPERLDTRADEARLRGLGYVIRRATPADREGAADLGYLLGGEGWRGEVLDAFTYDPIRLHVAAGATGIVAFAAQDVNGPALFGPTGTDPAARKLGLGTVLLKRCLSDALAQGFHRAEIGGAGPIDFYARAVGGRVCRVFWPLEKLLA